MISVEFIEYGQLYSDGYKPHAINRTWTKHFRTVALAAWHVDDLIKKAVIENERLQAAKTLIKEVDITPVTEDLMLYSPNGFDPILRVIPWSDPYILRGIQWRGLVEPFGSITVKHIGKRWTFRMYEPKLEE